MSLRDEIADLCRKFLPAEERADLILAIPEIAEAQETIRLQALRLMELSSEIVNARNPSISTHSEDTPG